MKQSNSSYIERALEQGRSVLFEDEAENFASQYGIPVPRSGLVKTEDNAVSFANEVGYPVVMKIASSVMTHKSDVGGVKVDIRSNAEAKSRFHELVDKLSHSEITEDFRGIYIQKMAPRSPEFIVGGMRDSVLGPAVMFGLGGIYVEIFKDVSFRLAPLSQGQALEMMREIKSYSILRGYRGGPPLDQEATANVLVAVGRIMSENKELDSIDINPLFVYPQGVMAVDVRIVLKKNSQ